jgi:hypothetical protein
VKSVANEKDIMVVRNTVRSEQNIDYNWLAGEEKIKSLRVPFQFKF